MLRCVNSANSLGHDELTASSGDGCAVLIEERLSLAFLTQCG